MDHLEIGLDLHKFREIIFIDHIDCGAYKNFYPDIKSFEEEIVHHRENLQKTRDTLKEKFPDFNFKAFLMY